MDLFMIKKLRQTALFSIVAFIAFNIVILGLLAVGNNNLKRPHPLAKALFSIAEGVNDFYVVPFGRSFLSAPGRAIRDIFYNAGMSHIPQEDAEREIWWFRIRFAEFKLVYQRHLDFALQGPRNELKEQYQPWMAEIYNHLISPTWTSPLADDNFRKDRIPSYISTALLYVRDSVDIKSKFIDHNDSGFTHGFRFQKRYFKDVSSTQDIARIYEHYTTLKESFPKEYDQFESTPEGLKDSLFDYYSHTIFIARDIVQGKFNCQESAIKLWIESREKFPKSELFQGFRVIDLGHPEKKAALNQGLINIFYGLEDEEPSLLIGHTLQDQCSLLKDEKFKKLEYRNTIN
jgi:hypothetical protein